MSSYTPRRITSALILGALMLTLVSEITHVVTFNPNNSETYRLGWAFPLRNGYMEWFSMSISSPVPSAYTALLFMISAVLTGRLAYWATRLHHKIPLWSASGLCILYAVDKIMGLHLALPIQYRQLLLSQWIIGSISIIPVTYSILRLFPRQVQLWFISGGLLLAGSFAIDRWSIYIMGKYHGHHMVGALIGDAEGLMEMLGAVLVIHSMLVYRAGEGGK